MLSKAHPRYESLVLRDKIVKASKGPEELFKKKGYFVDMFTLELKQHIIRTFRCTVNEEGEIYCILSIDEKL